jgi:hypothetical protein
MIPAIVGVITLDCIFGAALLGMFLRTTLAERHLTSDSRDTVKIAIAMIATITGMVLGLLVFSAKSSFDSKVTGLKEAAAKLILLDRTLREYGAETKDIRERLRQQIVARIHQLWPEDLGQVVATSTLSHGSGLEQLEDRLLSLSPGNDSQRWLSRPVTK